MRAWAFVRQLLAMMLCALLASPAYSSEKIESRDQASGGVYPKTRVWGSNEKILLHARAVGQLRIKLCWGYENCSPKKALGSGVTYDYDAFGNLIHSTGTTPNNYLFAGEQFDPDLGLYYNTARYLNTSTGRFWSMDTYEGEDTDPLTLHSYLYVGAEPVDEVDPSGNEGIDEAIGSFSLSSTINAMSTLNFHQIVSNFTPETLYVRAFAPWKAFGGVYAGDNRSFTTSREMGVTSRINTIVKFLLPSADIVSSTAYSDPSQNVYTKNTATATPTLTVTSKDEKINLEVAAALPLIPHAPDIDVKLDMSVQELSGQACYAGYLYGDAFPNVEVFVVNKENEATMLQTFATKGGAFPRPTHVLTRKQ